MNELQVFTHPDFGEIGIIEIDGKPYFPATKCAEALGYANPQKAIRDHCKGVNETVTPTPGGEQTIRVIPEGDLYRLIMKSQLPTAEKFERWVFDEVLPSIRKHGAYMTPQTLHEALSDPRNMAKVFTALADEQERSRALQAQIEADAPKVLFADSVSVSETSIQMGDLAKLLKQNGVQIGRTRLFAYMRDNGYLMKSGTSSENMPMQRSMEKGLFEVKMHTVNFPDGRILEKPTTMVTGKGQVYFVNKFLAQAAEKTV